MGGMDLPVMPPVKPMLAKSVPEVPTGDLVYEPKWDGFRCIVFRDGDEVELGSPNERPLTRYFPKVVTPAADHIKEYRYGALVPRQNQGDQRGSPGRARGRCLPAPRRAVACHVGAGWRLARLGLAGYLSTILREPPVIEEGGVCEEPDSSGGERHISLPAAIDASPGISIDLGEPPPRRRHGGVSTFAACGPDQRR
jgi:hypothetical protein